MGPVQFADISTVIQLLHKSMKNVIEIVFAISPLLALSTHSWAAKACNSTYLLRVSRFYLFLIWQLITIAMKRFSLTLATNAQESSSSLKTKFLRLSLPYRKGSLDSTPWVPSTLKSNVLRKIWPMTILLWTGLICYHLCLPMVSKTQHQKFLPPPWHLCLTLRIISKVNS